MNLQNAFMMNAVKSASHIDVDRRSVDSLVTPNNPNSIVDEYGLPIVKSCEELAKVDYNSLRAAMQLTGLYVYPTFELIDFLKEFIPDLDKSIEIGSGNGVIARELGIKATDNYMQSTKFKPKNVKESMIHKAALEHIDMLGAKVPYGSNVIQCDAVEAVRRFKPETVLGCFITHKWREGMTEGNTLGVDEELIYKKKSTKRYIMCGNLKTHAAKPLLAEQPCEQIIFDGLVCRAEHSDLNRIFVWEK